LTSVKINSNSFSSFFPELNLVDEYHDYQYTAKRYLEKIKWANDENIYVIEDLANRYISYNYDRKMVLENDNTGDKLVLPYTHRFHHSYLSKINKKLDKIRKSRVSGVHIVLTTNPANFTNLIEATKNIKKSWNKLATYLRKKWGRLNYLCVCEMTHTTDFLPHLHIIIWGKHHWSKKAPLIPQKKLSDLWQKYGQGQVVFIRSFTVNIAGYLMKYIRKQQKDITYGALLWAMKCRTFSISQNLNEILKEEKTIMAYYRFLFTTFDKDLMPGYALAGSETATTIAYMLRNLKDKSSVVIA